MNANQLLSPQEGQWSRSATEHPPYNKSLKFLCPNSLQKIQQSKIVHAINDKIRSPCAAVQLSCSAAQMQEMQNNKKQRKKLSSGPI